MTDVRVKGLPAATSIADDDVLAVDSTTLGARSLPVARVTAEAMALATQAAAQANSATSQANAARDAANQATTTANQAAATANDASERAEAAIDAVGDISELAVPLMSADTRGGAKLGSGLKVEDGTLSLGDIVTDSCDGPIYSVDAEGWSEQVSTTGKNLIYTNDGLNDTNYGYTAKANNGIITLNGTSSANYPKRVSIFVTIPAGTYTLSASVTGTVANDCVFLTVFKDNNWSNDHIMVDAGTYNKTAFSCTFTISSSAEVSISAQINSTSVVNLSIDSFQLESGSTATEWEPYTGAAPSPSPEFPQTIDVCRGRNLLDESTMKYDGYYINSSGDPGTIYNASGCRMYFIPVKRNADYTVSFNGGNRTRIAGYSSPGVSAGKTGTLIYAADSNASPKTFNSGNSDYIGITVTNDTTSNPDSNAQLELGSTATPYVPYGHIGLDIYDANNAHMSTVPIPLPSKGWAGGVGNYADTLSINGAGQYEWTCEMKEHTFVGTEDWGIVGNYASTGGGAYILNSGLPGGKLIDPHQNSLCNKLVSVNGIPAASDTTGTIGYWNGLGQNIRIRPFEINEQMTASQIKSWLASNPLTFLYPLTTPTTEHGYVDLPMDIPEGSTITIPELEDTNVRCFVHGAAELAIHAANWGHRAKEQELRIAALEDAVASLATQ